MTPKPGMSAEMVADECRQQMQELVNHLSALQPRTSYRHRSLEPAFDSHEHAHD